MLHATFGDSFDETKKNMPPPQTSAPPAKGRIPLSAGAAGAGRSLDPSGGMSFRTEEARRLLPKPRMILGNQATLRMLGKAAQPESQGKGGCGCSGSGGGCSCKAKSESPFKRSAEGDAARGVAPSAAREEPVRVGELHEAAPEDEETEKEEYSEDGLLKVFQGSGTCVNGGAASTCKPATGVFSLDTIDNTCCTKGCTEEHEAQHKTDFDGWGCCKSLSTAWNAKGADKAALVKKYNEWQRKVVPITECNAYTVGMNCADKLAKAKDCSGAGKGTDCCLDIAEYRDWSASQAKSYCAKAPKKAEPCPTF